jgi:hypothetical protein
MIAIRTREAESLAPGHPAGQFWFQAPVLNSIQRQHLLCSYHKPATILIGVHKTQQIPILKTGPLITEVSHLTCFNLFVMLELELCLKHTRKH